MKSCLCHISKEKHRGGDHFPRTKVIVFPLWKVASPNFVNIMVITGVWCFYVKRTKGNTFCQLALVSSHHQLANWIRLLHKQLSLHRLFLVDKEVTQSWNNWQSVSNRKQPAVILIFGYQERATMLNQSKKNNISRPLAFWSSLFFSLFVWYLLNKQYGRSKTLPLPNKLNGYNEPRSNRFISSWLSLENLNHFLSDSVSSLLNVLHSWRKIFAIRPSGCHLSRKCHC